MLFEQLNTFQDKLHNVETVEHIKIVEILSEFIAKKLKLNEKDIIFLKQMSRLHDIGKIYLPIEILEKPGKLTTEEYKIVQKHSNYGRDILREFGFTDEETQIIWQHHERCDGSGYPNGLKCDEINILAKIVSVVDVFEALLSKRSYKKQWTLENVYDYFKNDNGKEFCPKIVNILLENIETMSEIRKLYVEK